MTITIQRSREAELRQALEKLLAAHEACERQNRDLTRENKILQHEVAEFRRIVFALREPIQDYIEHKKRGSWYRRAMTKEAV